MHKYFKIKISYEQYKLIVAALPRKNPRYAYVTYKYLTLINYNYKILFYSIGFYSIYYIIYTILCTLY